VKYKEQERRLIDRDTQVTCNEALRLLSVAGPERLTIRRQRQPYHSVIVIIIIGKSEMVRKQT